MSVVMETWLPRHRFEVDEYQITALPGLTIDLSKLFGR